MKLNKKLKFYLEFLVPAYDKEDKVNELYFYKVYNIK